MKLGKSDSDKSTVVVAEIGNNHEGNMDVARELVRQAARCGADIVKFQTFKTHLFQSPSDTARVARLKSFELTQPQFVELGDLARSLGLGFMSTPLDLESLRFLVPIVDALKIASGDNDFVPLIDAAARSGKPVVLSSGMTDLADIRRSVTLLQDAPHAVLHCVSSYPAPDDQMNLRAIPMLANALGCTIGYSDHTLGIDACIAAVALGAKIIEKHFTLDKHYSDFRDHQLSADPPEMSKLVETVRRVEKLLGRAEKERQPCEGPIEIVARRSIMAARDLPVGTVLTEDALVCLRPAGGLSPIHIRRILGRTLKRAMKAAELLVEGDWE